MQVRFLVDAPAPGLAPGRYKSRSTMYARDFTRDGASPPLSRVLGDVVVTVNNYGCTISAPAQITMNNAERSVSTAQVVASCADGGAPSPLPIVAWLTMKASGASAGASADPQRLGVPNSRGSIYIRGNWSSTAPTCADSDMYFDSLDGISLGQVAPQTKMDFGVIPISFRLCTTEDVAPGAYTAQATISIVQR